MPADVKNYLTDDPSGVHRHRIDTWTKKLEPAPPDADGHHEPRGTLALARNADGTFILTESGFAGSIRCNPLTRSDLVSLLDLLATVVTDTKEPPNA